MTRPEWYRDTDGVWRNPRYPKGTNKPHEGVNLSYDDTTNGATLSVFTDETGTVTVDLTFANLGALHADVISAIQQCQKENSILWKEKEAIMIREDGYEPHINRRR